MVYHLAVDIGASSGRHIVSWLEDGILKTQEVYRFKNGLHKQNGALCWDIKSLFAEIKNGMKECKNIGKVPSTFAIDTWGVDFVLLDKNDNVIGDSVGYRDSRTDGMPEKVYSVIAETELYKKTGIKEQIFNTVFQLMSIKENHADYFDNAETFLMLPDYFVFLLTGNKFNEYTNASTTGLLSLETNDWDYAAIEKLGMPKKIFRPVSQPTTFAGELKADIKAEIGYDMKVYLAASHDTASAVMSVPSNEEDVMYISSGTWSLFGIESLTPINSDEARQLGFTNEGGYTHRYRFLKNIMGLWMIQNVRHEYDDRYSFDDLCDGAAESDIESIIDVCDNRFLAPENMIEEIKSYCRDYNLRVPETYGEVAAVIYNSLAKCYADAAKGIEKLTGKTYKAINIIGGGSKDPYLNEMTAKASGKKVVAGPSEATAIGNLLSQCIASGEINDLTEARELVKRSFSVNEY